MKTEILKRIESYLKGTMNPEEKQAFEKELASDEDLRTSLEEYRLSYKYIEELGRLDLKDRLREIDASMVKDSETGKVIPLWVKRALQVAAVALVAFGLFRVFGPSPSLTTDEAFSEYFNTYNSPGVLRDTNASQTLHWQKGVEFYDNGRFDEAIKEFEHPEAGIPNYLRSFYLGVSYLSQEVPAPGRALDAFDAVLETENDYMEQARWYKALSLIGLKRIEEARTILKDIVSSGAYNKAQAEKLLGEKIED